MQEVRFSDPEYRQEQNRRRREWYQYLKEHCPEAYAEVREYYNAAARLHRQSVMRDPKKRQALKEYQRRQKKLAMERLRSQPDLYEKYLAAQREYQSRYLTRKAQAEFLSMSQAIMEKLDNDET